MVTGREEPWLFAFMGLFLFCAFFVLFSSVFFFPCFLVLPYELKPIAVYNVPVVSCRWRALEPVEESDYENPVAGLDTRVDSASGVYSANDELCERSKSDCENPVTGCTSGQCEWSGVPCVWWMTRDSLKSHDRNPVTGYTCEWTVGVECSVVRVLYCGLASSTRPPSRPWMPPVKPTKENG